MKWYDIGLFAMAAVVAAPLIYIVVVIVRIILDSIQEKRRPKKPRKEIDSPYGPLVRDDTLWHGEISSHGLLLTVEDIDDEPDPAFMARLPRILRDLPALEEIARREDDYLKVPAELIGIASAGHGSDHDLELSFELTSESDGGVYVYFRGEEYAGSMYVD